MSCAGSFRALTAGVTGVALRPGVRDVDIPFDNSIVATGVQSVGVALLAVLSFLLTRSIRRRFLDYWAAAWGCLTVALTAFVAAFCLNAPARPLFGLYFFGEYAFGYLLLAGCAFAAGGAGRSRRHLWLVPAGTAVAALLAAAPVPFNARSIPHAAIMAAFWARAHAALRPLRRHPPGPGVHVASVALLLLAADFILYVATSALSQAAGRPPPFAFARYSSLFDLILEMLLAFGTVMIATESVRRDLERANAELRSVGARLGTLAERDPLTEALNRHAFYALLHPGPADPPPLHGCVAMVDLDDMKGINDAHGHAAGDAAVRAVAQALRQVLRADDLLFRWGGDEFLLIARGLPEADLRHRLGQVEARLGPTPSSGARPGQRLAFSFGVAGFDGPHVLEAAIGRADHEMYQSKQTRKTATGASPPAAPSPPALQVPLPV